MIVTMMVFSAQVEGLVADYNLSLKDLIGMIKTFFHAIGITQLRFKPAFNPYTEPSMEVRVNRVRICFCLSLFLSVFFFFAEGGVIVVFSSFCFSFHYCNFPFSRHDIFSLLLLY